jgi:hypothetical protein
MSCIAAVADFLICRYINLKISCCYFDYLRCASFFASAVLRQPLAAARNETLVFYLRLLIATGLRRRCAALGCATAARYNTVLPAILRTLEPRCGSIANHSHTTGRLIQVKLPCFTLLQCYFTLQGPHCNTTVARDGQSYRPQPPPAADRAANTRLPVSTTLRPNCEKCRKQNSHIFFPPSSDAYQTHEARTRTKVASWQPLKRAYI